VALASNWTLLRESCSPGRDRYGLRCVVRDARGAPLFRSRYDDFPW